MVIEAKTEYELTADEQGMIQPMMETIERLQKDVQAILNAVTRLRKLEGNWALQGNKLVLVPPPNHNGNG